MIFRSGRAQQGICARRDYRHVIIPSSCTVIPRQTLNPGGRFGYMQRDCYAQLYCIPRRTRVGILDAQLGSKAYLSVQNHNNVYLSNPKPGYTSGGAAHGGAAGRGRARQDGTPTGRFAQEAAALLALQGIVDNRLERRFGSTNKGNPM